jgi:hypothetical protein
MLAAASITGIKFDTVNSSGFSAGDVPQGGVFIDLFKDNGDNVFNPATDSRVDRQETATGTGAYTFSDVADGHYYIQEELPSGFTQSGGPPFYTVDVINGGVYSFHPADFASVKSINIDDFSNPNPEADYFITGVNPNPFTLTTTGSGIIGGQRDLTVNVLGVPNPLSASGFIGVFDTDQGVFNLAQGPAGPGTEAMLHYNAGGAGLGANLTASGNTGIRIDFDFLQDLGSVPIDATVTATGPGGTATFSTLIAPPIPPNPDAFDFFVPFSSFVPTGSFSFSNVTSLQVNLNHNGVAVQALDLQITQIAASSFNFGNFPNPSCLAGFVYVDANNNGNKDLGEPPISGVIITLTGTNDLGQSITQTTTTDGNGAYLFANLRPGTYKLNEKQPINFIDGKDTIGTPGGTTSNDMFSNIMLPAGFCGMNNNFGELGLTPTFATKRSLLSPAQPVNLMAVYAADYSQPTADNGSPVNSAAKTNLVSSNAAAAAANAAAAKAAAAKAAAMAAANAALAAKAAANAAAAKAAAKAAAVKTAATTVKTTVAATAVVTPHAATTVTHTASASTTGTTSLRNLTIAEASIGAMIAKLKR